ncbi:co-chaperone GroES (plasmid) [Paenibacillus sp. EC2-1]|uniref:co-chaperone GroES n=1 Tax=Paenibacillus sp. EC2-1 TaxID=3388665 RepID=UPI003BEECEDE
MAERTFLEGFEGLQPMGARLGIRPDATEESTNSGIILTGSQEPKFEGTVVVTGPGARLENGSQMPMDTKAGDRVVYSRLAGVPVEYNGEQILIINERDIIAVVGSVE